MAYIEAFSWDGIARGHFYWKRGQPRPLMHTDTALLSHC
jgi:hypothetical protein